MGKLLVVRSWLFVVGKVEWFQRGKLNAYEIQQLTTNYQQSETNKNAAKEVTTNTRSVPDTGRWTQDS